jgi:hypothetical protein
MKPKLTEAQHAALGDQLRAMNGDVLDLRVLLSNACGKTSKEARAALAIHKALVTLRSELDSRLFRDFPDNADVARYFGPCVAKTTTKE